MVDHPTVTLTWLLTWLNEWRRKIANCWQNILDIKEKSLTTSAYFHQKMKLKQVAELKFKSCRKVEKMFFFSWKRWAKNITLRERLWGYLCPISLRFLLNAFQVTLYLALTLIVSAHCSIRLHFHIVPV